METVIVQNTQSPIESDELFKSNFDYLITNHTYYELQKIAKELGEEYVVEHKRCKGIKRKCFSKNDLCISFSIFYCRNRFLF